MSSSSHNERPGYLCAFQGRRDSYQVAIALSEHHLLRQLITDFYAYTWMTRVAACLPARYGEALNRRRTDALPDACVSMRPSLLVTEAGWRRAPVRVRQAQAAAALGRAAAAAARRTRSDLLLYHSYAWEAFTASYAHQPKRVLFQYHPHYAFEQNVYAQEAARYPRFAVDLPTRSWAAVPAGLISRLSDAWMHADLILCASSFTRQSLVWAGADPSKCRVIPYGYDPLPLTLDARPNPDVFQVLFVGSAGPRKGLHHLLMAWQKLRTPYPKKLVLVCGAVSPELAPLVAQTPHVTVLPRVSQAELARLYATSQLFAMPSLMEGFGLVYGEALSYGCPVLGTPNSGLPDLGGETDGIFLVTPGDVDELLAKLETLAGEVMSSDRLRAAARRCAGTRSWRRFRQELVATLDTLS